MGQLRQQDSNGGLDILAHVRPTVAAGCKLRAAKRERGIIRERLPPATDKAGD
jgi:hypothetical protein